MKSNRMRLYKPEIVRRQIGKRLESELLFSTQQSGISIEELPAPLPVEKVSPDQLVEDILVATLRRVQNSASSPQVSAAAARYLALLAEHAL